MTAFLEECWPFNGSEKKFKQDLPHPFYLLDKRVILKVRESVLSYN